MSGFFARLTGAAPPPPPAAAAAPAAAPAAGEENKWWWQRIGDWWAGGTAEGAPDGELPGSTSTSSTSTTPSTSTSASTSTTSTAAPPDSPAKAKVDVSPEDELARVAALLGNPAALAEAGLACAKEEVSSSSSPSSGSSAAASSSSSAAAAPAAAAPNSEVAGRVIFALADLLPLTVVEAAARGEGEGTLLLEEPDDDATDEASTTLPSFVCGGNVTAGRPAVRLQVVRELSPSHQQQRASSSPAASPSSGGKSVVTYAVVARLAVPKPDGADAPHRFVVLERELVRRARREDFLRTSLDRRPSPKKAASAAAASAPAGKSEPMETESTTTAATTAAATTTATTTKTPATATADSTPAATPPEPPATAALDAEPAAVGVDTTAAATVATRECHACGFTGMTGRFCSKCGAAGKGCSACGFAAATGKFCSRCGGALAAPPSVVVGGQAAKARPNKTLPARAGTAMVLSRPGGSDGAAGGGGAAAAGGGATARSVFDRAPGSALGTQAPRARPSGPRQVASTRAFGTQQPRAGGGGGAGPGVRRTASARVLTGTDALLQWCVNETDSYDDVDVVNFTRSWKDGRAFAALVDNLTDGALGYRSLTEEEKNDKEGETIMQRAFDVAEDKLGVPKLLDAEDIVVVQDRHSILTYIVTLHKAAHGRMGERGL